MALASGTLRKHTWLYNNMNDRYLPTYTLTTHTPTYIQTCIPIGYVDTYTCKCLFEMNQPTNQPAITKPTTATAGRKTSRNYTFG